MFAISIKEKRFGRNNKEKNVRRILYWVLLDLYHSMIGRACSNSPTDEQCTQIIGDEVLTSALILCNNDFCPA